MSIKIGDSVQVKPGIKVPDFEEFEMNGWQGRVVEIDKDIEEDEILISIEWDSLTLKQMPAKFIILSEIEELDWQNMDLYESDLIPADHRDKEPDVEIMQDLLSDKYFWASLGDEGQRIMKVLGDVDPRDEMACYQKWITFLEKELTFPIKAILSESENSWSIKKNDPVQIKCISNVLDIHGVMATVILKKMEYDYPLCDLEIVDEKSSEYQLIKEYRIWFDNR